MVVKDAQVREVTIFSHNGNKIKTEDREINIIARFEEPLVVVLGQYWMMRNVRRLFSCQKTSFSVQKSEVQKKSVIYEQVAAHF